MSRRRRRRQASMALSLFAFQDIVTSVIGIMLLVSLLLCVKLIESTQASPSYRTSQLLDQLEEELISLDQQIADLDRTLHEQSLTFDSGALLRESVLHDQLGTLQDERARLSTELSTLAEQEADQQRRLADLETLRDSRDAERDEIARLTDRTSAYRQQLQDLISQNRVLYNAPIGQGKEPWLIELNDGSSILAAKIGAQGRPKRFTSVRQFEAWATTQVPNRISMMLLVKPQSAHILYPLLARLQKSGFSVGFDLLTADQSAIDPEKGAASP